MGEGMYIYEVALAIYMCMYGYGHTNATSMT